MTKFENRPPLAFHPFFFASDYSLSNFAENRDHFLRIFFLHKFVLWGQDKDIHNIFDSECKMILSDIWLQAEGAKCLNCISNILYCIKYHIYLIVLQPNITY